MGVSDATKVKKTGSSSQERVKMRLFNAKKLIMYAIIVKRGGDIMTNDAVRGYVILAMKELGYTKDKIEEVIDELHYTFDTISEYDAEQFYYNPFKYEKKEVMKQLEKEAREEQA